MANIVECPTCGQKFIERFTPAIGNQPTSGDLFCARCKTRSNPWESKGGIIWFDPIKNCPDKRNPPPDNP